MPFSVEWNNIYKKNKQIALWPMSDLVSFVMRYVKPAMTREFKILELGCGSGANILFLTQLGCQYYAVEGSENMAKRLKEKFPNLKNNIICADFTKDVPFSFDFDLVIDRSSLTCNTTAGITNSIKHIYKKLKSNGKFIGIDWYSTKHSEFKRGKKITGDIYSKSGYKDGQFADLGIVHFSDKKHLIELFKKFEINILEHKIHRREKPQDNFVFASWNFLAVKNE